MKLLSPDSVLAMMSAIERDNPLQIVSSEDGRYCWPERWAALMGWLAELREENKEASDDN